MTSVPASTLLRLPLLRRGKVRELYAVDDDTVLLVASDRVSAFDVVLRDQIPWKGLVLTQLSSFWFTRLRAAGPSHFITARTSEILRRIPALEEQQEAIRGRAMLCRRAVPIPFECVVRGYLAGSAWAEYRASGTLAGEPLPRNLMQGSRLEPPLFSPATKAVAGHDENVAFGRLEADLGPRLADLLRARSLALYRAGAEHATGRGLIIADTKFEFGHAGDGSLLVIDELLTPDSSRFWPADSYRPGVAAPGFDKQPLRDYLAALREAGDWDGESPPPPLPNDVVRAMSQRYLEAFHRLTGAPLEDTGEVA